MPHGFITIASVFFFFFFVMNTRACRIIAALRHTTCWDTLCRFLQDMLAITTFPTLCALAKIMYADPRLGAVWKDIENRMSNDDHTLWMRIVHRWPLDVIRAMLLKCERITSTYIPTIAVKGVVQQEVVKWIDHEIEEMDDSDYEDDDDDAVKRILSVVEMKLHQVDPIGRSILGMVVRTTLFMHRHTPFGETIVQPMAFVVFETMHWEKYQEFDSKEFQLWYIEASRRTADDPQQRRSIQCVYDMKRENTLTLIQNLLLQLENDEQHRRIKLEMKYSKLLFTLYN